MKRYSNYEQIPYGANEYEVIHKSGKFFDYVIRVEPRLPNAKPGTRDVKQTHLIYTKKGELVKDATRWYHIKDQPLMIFNRLEEEARQKNIIATTGQQTAGSSSPPSYNPENDPVKKKIDEQFASIQKVIDESITNESKKLKRIQKQEMLNKIESLREKIDELEAE